MEKKNKKTIIIGFSVLLLTTLVLLGLTYAYYRTRIVGNEETKSISVVSKKLEVKYQNENAYIEASGIEPGYNATKTFEVTNTGDEEVAYGVKIDNVESTFTRTSDWIYTLTKNGEVIKENAVLPSSESYILFSSSIASKATDTYKIVITYQNLLTTDQSDDMGATLSLRLNIAEEGKMTWENAEEGTLLYAIKSNNTVANTLTTPGEAASLENEAVLASTEDDYGTSYYFRGNVEDNYVNFAGMCWRIVRIAGDGSTKLILEDQYTTCEDTETETTSAIYTGLWNIGTGNYGYESKNVDSDSSTESIMSYLKPVTKADKSMVKAFYDFQTTKLADYTDKLKSGDWCLGDTAYTRSGSSGSYTYTSLEEYNYSSSMYYDAYTRLTSENANGYQPTLKCNGTILNEFADVSGVSSEAPMYVSAITADEIVYAGGKYGEANGNYYLLNNYQKSNSFYFWSLSSDYFNGDYDRALRANNNGSLNSYDVRGYNAMSYTGKFRPSVSLASSAVITGGEGTLESPYIIG